MSGSAPLFLSPEVTASLEALRVHAARHPVDMPGLMAAIATPEGKAAHMEQMTRQSVEIPGPFPFMVVLSIETGHPCGVARHMSLSIDQPGRVPSVEALGMVAERLGFEPTFEGGTVWVETMGDGRRAINFIQPLAVSAQAGTA